MTTIKTVRNVALQVVADNNGEKRHVVALVNQEKTIENSNLEIRGEIPLPCRTNIVSSKKAAHDKLKSEIAREMILHYAFGGCIRQWYKAW